MESPKFINPRKRSSDSSFSDNFEMIRSEYEEINIDNNILNKQLKHESRELKRMYTIQKRDLSTPKEDIPSLSGKI